MSRDSFDDVDRALASGLSALAPEVGGSDETLAALRPQFRRARSRHRAMKVGGAVAVLVVIGSIAAVAAPSSRRTHVQVAAPPTTAATPTTKPPRSSTTSSTTTSIAPVATTTIPSGLASGTVNRHPFVPPPAPAATLPQTTPATAPSGSGNSGHGGSSGGSGPGPAITTTTTIPPDPSVHSFDSPGGHIGVRFANGKLKLFEVVPAKNYTTAYQRAEPTYIQVKFASAHGGWRIRVGVVGGLLTNDVGPA